MVIKRNPHESLIQYSFSHIVREHVCFADCSRTAYDNVFRENFTAFKFLVFLFRNKVMA